MSGAEDQRLSGAEDRRRFREVIAHFSTGVAIVTAPGPEGPVGMTANALCSLSLDPVLLLVCFERTARTLGPIERSGRFAVNVLRHEQHALSGVFSSKIPEPEKFQGVPWRSHEGVPVLEGVLAWLRCELRETLPGGDHTICVGAVTDLHHEPDGRPLVWYRGRYGTIGHEEPAEAELPN
jgi:3-hydroxy-9,10-secoandrosta-1,3,5(10)-triene-9,17-dione monooxygenase reductase component